MLDQVKLYVIAGLLAVAALLSGALWVQTTRLELADVRIESFEAAGRAHEATVAALNKRNKAQKEKTDVRISNAGAAVDLGADSLLDDIARRGVVGDGGVPGDSGLVTFDRAELDRALQDFAGEDAERSREGQKAVDALNELREWRKGK